MNAENFPFSTDKRPVCAMAKEMPLLLIVARKYHRYEAFIYYLRMWGGLLHKCNIGS